MSGPDLPELEDDAGANQEIFAGPDGGYFDLGANARPAPPAPPRRVAPATPPTAQNSEGCECPVCSEPLFEAMVAPCGHALCCECVAKLRQVAEAVVPAEWTMRPETAPKVPRCPECRLAVHKGQYRRCFALEKAARALYPDKVAGFTAKRKADGNTFVGGVNDLDDLITWKIAKEEQAVANAIGLVWKGIQGCMRNSTALLIRCRAIPAPPEPSGPYCPRGHEYVALGEGMVGRIRPRMRMTGDGGLDISEFVQQDAEAEVEAVLDTLWNCREEVARRLEAKGLKMTTFRYAGENHVLITWPDMPAAFGAAGAGSARSAGSAGSAGSVGSAGTAASTS